MMPSFNQAVYLEEAICSILDQGHPNLEFMILDGGSEDGSRTIIEKYASRLAYWRSEPDAGQSAAIAEGFARASGDLLGWVNSDDALLPGALQSIARAYCVYPSGGLFGGNYILIDQAGRIKRCKRHPANAGWFARHGIFAFNPPASFFKRQDYEAVGGLRLDLHHVMDTDLYIRMCFNGTRYVYVNRYLSVFRQHAAQKPTVHRAEARLESERMRRELWPRQLQLCAAQKRWRFLYMLCQIMNGNYLRMSIETLMSRGKHWRVGTTDRCSS
jgi:glycosyltransferase involved in cell wall biosynthesis